MEALKFEHLPTVIADLKNETQEKKVLSIQKVKPKPGQNTTSLINFLKSEVENGTGLTYKELKETYLEKELFYVALRYVTTTKKAICTAMEIPVEAGCRYKRNFEKAGLLKQSVYDTICPYTKHFARLISTNPDEFDELTNTNQLKLFL